LIERLQACFEGAYYIFDLKWKHNGTRVSIMTLTTPPSGSYRYSVVN